MEVSLVDVQGLPPGCLVSVRMGSTRRQALADPEKLKLLFPKGCSAKDPIKVDLLAPVGTAEMPFAPDANLYPLQVPVNGVLANLTLGITEAPAEKIKAEKPPSGLGFNLNSIYANMDFGKDEKGSVTPNTASRRHKHALEARTYLDKHQLLVFIHGLLQALIRDRPQDPWDFIIECATAAKKVGEMDPSGKTETKAKDVTIDEAPPPPLPPKPATRDFLDEDNEDEFYKERLNKEVMQKVEDADEIQQATPVITRPNTAREIEEALLQQKRSNQELVQQVAGQLEKVQPTSPAHYRPSVGTWLQTRSHTALRARQAVPIYAARPSVGTWLQTRSHTALRPRQARGDDLDEMCAKLYEGLLKASTDGRLHRLLAFAAATRTQVAPQAVTSQTTLKDTEAAQKLKDVREKTQAVLLQACADGRLEAALGNQEVRGTIVSAAGVEKTRATLQKLLLEADVEDRLDGIVKDSLVKDMRAKTQDALVKACADGRLAGALENQFMEAPPPQRRMPDEENEEEFYKQQSQPQARALTPSTQENARIAMQNALVEAYSDGRFETALNEVFQASPPPLPRKPASRDLEDEEPLAGGRGSLPEQCPPPLPPKPSRRDLQDEDNEDELYKETRKAVGESAKEVPQSEKQRQPFSAYYKEHFRGQRNAESVARRLFHDPASLRKQAEKMLEQDTKEQEFMKMLKELQEATKEQEFMRMLQEAAGKAGYELKLKPKSDVPAPTAPVSLPSGDPVAMFKAIDANNNGVISVDEFKTAYEKGLLSQAITKTEDPVLQRSSTSTAMIEDLQFRELTRNAVVQASHNGSLLAALDALDTEDEDDEENPFQEGDEIIERSTSSRGSILKRTKTELLVLMEDGHQEWKAAKSLKKVPKLNLASAIAIQQKDLESGLFAPADCALRGDEVLNRKDNMVGRILERTTTDCLVQREDGTQNWTEVEDLVQALRPADDVREGEWVVSARRGKRGRCMTKNSGEMLILHDDGSEEWRSLADVGVPKAVRKPPPPSLTPFASYYSKHFKGSTFAEGFARSFAPSAQPMPPSVQKREGNTEEVFKASSPQASAAPPALLPFPSYYSANFKGSDIVAGIARKCAVPRRRSVTMKESPPTSKPTSPSPKKRSFAANRALVRSLKSGEIGKIIDKMESADQANAKVARPAALLPFTAYYSANFVGSDIVQGIASTKVRSPSSPKARELFSRIDTDKDGVVNEREFKNAYVKGVVTKSPSMGPPPPKSSPSSLVSQGSDAAFAALEEKIRQRNERLMRESETLRKAPGNSSSSSVAKLASSSSAPTLGDVKADKLEEKVRERNDRFRRENESLLRENRRLKALADSKKTADQIAGENDQLRKELDGKRNGPS